jgi:hypothetical protein
VVTALDMLRVLWHRSGDRLERRLVGLTDAEFFWAPVEDAWTVKPDPTAPSGWTYDYEIPTRRRPR